MTADASAHSGTQNLNLKVDNEKRSLTKKTGSTTTPVWPQEATDIYEPIRPLGTGGFASVWMAKTKNPKKGGEDDLYVAIKVIGSGKKDAPKEEAAYARREIEILSEINHKHIVRLVRAFEPQAIDNAARSDSSLRCIALSLARGPTLEQMVFYGGALGLHIAREVSRQLVSAVAHLHGRAVIHRDIKCDNIIVTGAIMSDDACWDDGSESEAAAKEHRWHVTLIDFGFARALRPSEIDFDIGLHKTVHHIDRPEPPAADDGKLLSMCVDGPLNDESTSRGRDALASSISKRRVRNLSALGNRSYAAPEIVNGVRRLTRHLSSSLHGSLHGSAHGDASKRSGNKYQEHVVLGETVSDYGMVADAFSVGAVIRYMLTGVPPNIDVDEFLQRNPLAIVGSGLLKLAKKASRKKGKTRKRKKRYRRSGEIPTDAKQLIRALTHWDQNKRLTVRAAKTYSWLKLSDECTTSAKGNNNLSLSDHGGPVEYLPCALQQDEAMERSGKEHKRRGKTHITCSE